MTVRYRYLHISFLMLSLCLLLATASAGPAEHLWQSEQSQAGKDADLRLEKAVSVSLATTVADLLKQVQQQTGVAFSCEEALKERPLTVHLPKVRCKDVMAELADFMVSEWWAKEGEKLLERIQNGLV